MGEMDAKVTIGRFVRNLREQKHLTQEQLAAKTGITYQYLSGMENGRENFSIGILESLARALDCPLPQFIAGAFAPEPASATTKSIGIISAHKCRCRRDSISRICRQQ